MFITSRPVHDAHTEPSPLETRGWYAWVNKMPPSPTSLHFIGTVSAPTPGYDATLSLASPQGINPAELARASNLDVREERATVSGIAGAAANE